MSRLPWDDYFLQIAGVVSSRATCDRKHVGAVIVRDRTVLSTGYNGAPRGMAHCSEAGCDVDPPGGCRRVVHAEMNAVAQAAREGARVAGATLYCTTAPCWPCFRVLINAGVVRVVYGEGFWRDAERIAEAARTCGVELVGASP